MDATWWTKPEDLDDNQKEIISLDEDGSYLVMGPPGCGKTNLLVLKASQLYRNKIRHFAILTLGRVLKEFLVTGAEQYPFPNDKIQTYVGWATGVLKSNGMSVPEGDFDSIRDNLLASLQEVAKKKQSEDQFDCIFLDEAQDYSAEEIEVIRSFAKNVFAVGDNRQNIYSKTGGLDALAAFVDDVKELEHHYRCGIKICRVADGVMNISGTAEALEGTSNYDESDNPSSVEPYIGLDFNAQLEKCVENLKTQYRAYPEGLLGVLCPKRDDVKVVSEYLAKSDIGQHCQVQLFEGGYVALEKDRRIVITTVHGAKGLEFRALHLLCMDSIKKFAAQKKMTYTAVTRAKTTLSIYSAGSLPGYLEKGLVAADGGKPAKKVGLAELFGKG